MKGSSCSGWTKNLPAQVEMDETCKEWWGVKPPAKCPIVVRAPKEEIPWKCSPKAPKTPFVSPFSDWGHLYFGGRLATTERGQRRKAKKKQILRRPFPRPPSPLAGSQLQESLREASEARRFFAEEGDAFREGLALLAAAASLQGFEESKEPRAARGARARIKRGRLVGERPSQNYLRPPLRFCALVWVHHFHTRI